MLHKFTWSCIAVPGICLLICASAVKGTNPASAIDLYYPGLMDTLMGGYYAAADTICAQIEQTWPGHPAATYARATVLYTHMIDREDTVGRAAFLGLADSCLRRCEDLERAGESSSEISYLKGSSYSTRGMLFLHEKNVLGGIRELMAARGAFDQAIQSDSTFYDAYLGRGAYRVAVARHADMIKWLPFIPREDDGWRDLWTAVNHAKFSRYSALSAMVWFAIEDKNFSLADSMVTLGLARFPNCRAFLWPKLSVEVKQNQWSAAELTAQNLLAQYLALPDNNGYETTGLYWRLMICSDSLGKPDSAAAYARLGVGAFRSADSEQRRQDKIKQMSERIRTEQGQASEGRSKN